MEGDTPQEEDEERYPFNVDPEIVEKASLSETIAENGQSEVAKPGKDADDGKVNLETVDVIVI